MDWISVLEQQNLLLTIGIALLVMCFVKFMISQPKNLPPGPSVIQLCGVAFTAIRTQVDSLQVLSSWANKYGDVMSFTVGLWRIVVLNSYEVIVDAFQNPDLNDRPKSLILEEATGIANNGIVLSNGAVWREQRKFVHSVFRSLGVGKKNYEETIAAEMRQLIEALEHTKERPFDPSFLFYNAIANTICSFVFGTQYTYSNTEFQRILYLINTNLRLSRSGGLLAFLPIPGISKFPFGTLPEITQNTRDIQAYLVNMIDEHEKSFDPNNPRDFIDLYLKKMAGEEGRETSFTKTNLNASIADLFFAGTETTSSTMKWAVLFMMAYPDVQSRVQQELDDVVGRKRLPRMDDRQRLPFTNAVMLEIQRRGVVTPLGVPHVAGGDTTLRGYTIPKGAIILPNIWKVMSNNDLWEEADAFRPERFLTEDGQLIKREELIVFSTGRRVCLGEQLARMELFLCFTSLLHRFTFKKPDNTPRLSFEGVLGLTRNTSPYETCAIKRY